jgi:hypothetical protein
MVNVRTNFDHLATELMPEDRVGLEVVLALDDLDIRAADAHGLDLEQHIIGILNVRDGFLFENEIANILENVRLHLIHGYSP